MFSFKFLSIDLNWMTISCSIWISIIIVVQSLLLLRCVTNIRILPLFIELLITQIRVFSFKLIISIVLSKFKIRMLPTQYLISCTIIILRSFSLINVLENTFIIDFSSFIYFFLTKLTPRSLIFLA
jgi:hypothetical protein